MVCKQENKATVATTNLFLLILSVALRLSNNQDHLQTEKLCSAPVKRKQPEVDVLNPRPLCLGENCLMSVCVSARARVSICMCGAHALMRISRRYIKIYPAEEIAFRREALFSSPQSNVF